MSIITGSAEAVLEGVRMHLREHGVAPSVREISARTGLAASTVRRQLGELEQVGVLTRLPGIARGIVLTERAEATDPQLLDLAWVFELQAAHEGEWTVDLGTPEEAGLGTLAGSARGAFAALRLCGTDDDLDSAHELVRHAIRCALFHGYARGLRRAVGNWTP